MKYLYIFLGFLFLGLGAAGVFIPLVPTVPFLLLTSYFFLKGSDRLNAWFEKTKFYNKHVGKYNKHNGLTLKSKLSILIPVQAMIIFLFIVTDSLMIRILIPPILAYQTYFFIKMRTVPEEEWNFGEAVE